MRRAHPGGGQRRLRHGCRRVRCVARAGARHRGHQPPPTDNATLRGLPKVKVGVSWVPWTHRRLAAATGYGAGVRQPGWYDHVFRHPGPDGVTRFFVDAAQLLRGARHGSVARPPHRRVADGRDAVGPARPAAPGSRRGARCRRRGDGRVAARDRRRLVVGEAIGEVPARGAAGAAGTRPARPATPGAAEAEGRAGGDRARPAHAERPGQVAPPAPARRPRRRMGRARGGPRHERDVPRDLAGGVGARAVGAPGRARRARHHRRAGGDQPARRAGRQRRWSARVGGRPRPGAARPTRRRGRADRRPALGARRQRSRHRPADGGARSTRPRPALRRRARHRRVGAANRVRRARRPGAGRSRRRRAHHSTTPRPVRWSSA